MVGSEQDLKNYVCKIADKEGVVRGTGFFILPGYVATCYHVVEDCKENVSIGILGEPDLIPSEIKRGEYELYDIAVLRINRENCPVLPLNPKYKLGKISSHGYSIEHSRKDFPEGFPMMSELMGTTVIKGGLNMLVLKNAEVDYGLSGAPAVDENGTVIGIIRMKYQEGQKALVIPADYLLEKWEELKKYHESLQEKNRPKPEIDIPSIQSVLRKDEIKEGEFFRKEPAWVDFKENYIVERKEVYDIIVGLEKNRIQVVNGEPASGKSTVLKNVGYKLANWNQVVYFLELKKHFNKNITKIYDEKSIFIVDDAHLYVPECERLIRNFRIRGKGYLIIGSRKISEIPKDASEFEYFSKNSIKIEAEDVTKEMINEFLMANYHLGVDKIKLISNNLQKYNKDLWFLSWALKSFNPERDLVEEKEIHEKIRDSIRKIKTGEEKLSINAEDVFLPLSIFYRYEIPIERDFLEKEMDIESDTINQLIEMSEIVETEEIEKPKMLSLHHSSIAQLYFSAYQKYPSLGNKTKKKILNLKDDSFLEYCLFYQYITTTDIRNSIDAINNLWLDFFDNKGGRTLIEKLIVEDKIGKVLVRAIDKEKNLAKIDDCISAILRANRDVAEKLVNRLNIEILYSKIEKEEDSLKIGNCMSTVSKANREVGKKLFNLINFETLLSKIEKYDISTIGWFISIIFKINREKALILINTVSSKIENEEYLFCWDDINECDCGRFIEFFERSTDIFFKRSTDIQQIKIIEIKRLNNKTITIYLEKDYFQIELNEERTNVSFKKNGEIKICKYEFIVKMENDKLNIFKMESLQNIVSCVREIFSEANGILLEKDKNVLDMKKEMSFKLIDSISSRIEKEDNILLIGDFITDICNINKEVALKIINDAINIEYLLSIIKNENILGTCFALAHFRWVSKNFYYEIKSRLNPKLNEELRRIHNRLHPEVKDKFHHPQSLKVLRADRIFI